jgi:hypothetical protein
VLFPRAAPQDAFTAADPATTRRTATSFSNVFPTSQPPISTS